MFDELQALLATLVLRSESSPSAELLPLLPAPLLWPLAPLLLLLFWLLVGSMTLLSLLWRLHL